MTNQDSTPSPRRSSAAVQIAQAYRTAHEVLSAAMSMGLLVGAGYWADRETGWSPGFTIFGACLGFVVAGASLRALLRRLDQESGRDKKRKPGSERERLSK